ncbi:hypothetical protein FRX31_028622, partial [Thalictrum thalictroides]
TTKFIISHYEFEFLNGNLTKNNSGIDGVGLELCLHHKSLGRPQFKLLEPNGDGRLLSIFSMHNICPSSSLQVHVAADYLQRPHELCTVELFSPKRIEALKLTTEDEVTAMVESIIKDCTKPDKLILHASFATKVCLKMDVPETTALKS